jgi:hypothetical protein
MRSYFVGILSLGLLAACGGGGSSDTSTASAEGAYSGTITGSGSAAAFEAVVLEDGELWTLYGNQVGGELFVLGLLQGQGASSNGSFTSTTLRDFGTSPALAASVSATYVPNASISGTLTEAGGSITLSGTATPAANFNYNAPASSQSIAGSWQMSLSDGETLPLTIAQNGTASGTTSGGCSIVGTVTPRPSGKNVYNVALTFGPAPCALANQSETGIAVYTTLSTGVHQLIAGAIDSSRSFGTIAFGTR